LYKNFDDIQINVQFPPNFYCRISVGSRHGALASVLLIIHAAGVRRHPGRVRGVRRAVLLSTDGEQMWVETAQ